jgi:nucleoside-diphosphate-sugar epimerase
MRILLTGASGFIGSHLAQKLANEGVRVIAAVRDTSDLARLRSQTEKIKLFDLGKESVEDLFLPANRPEAIVHLATCYGRKGESPQEIYRSNLYFPMTLMEAAAAGKELTFINTDTYWPESYGALPDYALSKKQFLTWGRRFAQRNDIRFVNVRLQHVYGPGDDPDKFFPSLVRDCLANLPEIRLTEGHQKRDFIFITDVVSAYLCVLQGLGILPEGFTELDVGSGTSVTIRELALMIRDATGSSSELKFGALPSRRDEIMDSVAEISGLTRLGWRPGVSLKEGIAITVRSCSGVDGRR